MGLETHSPGLPSKRVLGELIDASQSDERPPAVGQRPPWKRGRASGVRLELGGVVVPHGALQRGVDAAVRVRGRERVPVGGPGEGGPRDGERHQRAPPTTSQSVVRAPGALFGADDGASHKPQGGTAPVGCGDGGVAGSGDGGFDFQSFVRELLASFSLAEALVGTVRVRGGVALSRLANSQTRQIRRDLE